MPFKDWPDLRLSLCMIVKDEAEGIAQAIASARPISDEIVVLDTGSTDGTQKIARDLGARVETYAWSNDFSAARNQAKALARGDWILMLDGDELIAPGDAPRLRAAAQSGAADVYDLLFYNYTRQDQLKGWRPTPERYRPIARGLPGYVVTDSIRLFANHPGIEFVGCVHESIAPSVRRLGLRLATLEVPLHNFGKARDAARMQAKLELYERLGAQKLDVGHDDPQRFRRAAHEMAKQLVEAGKHEAAQRVLCSAQAAGVADETTWSMLASAAERLGQTEEAHQCFQEALARRPDDFAALSNYAAFLAARGALASAQPLFERALALDPDHWASHFNLGLCLEGLGRREASVKALRRARDLNPQNPLMRAALQRLEDAAP